MVWGAGMVSGVYGEYVGISEGVTIYPLIVPDEDITSNHDCAGLMLLYLNEQNMEIVTRNEPATRKLYRREKIHKDHMREYVAIYGM